MLARWLEEGTGRRHFKGHKTLYRSRCDKPELEETVMVFTATNTKFKRGLNLLYFGFC